MRTSALAAVLLLLLLAVQGCTGTQDPADEASGARTATPRTVDILRIGDDGASVALDVDETATVFLPTSYVWEEPVVDGDAVTISADVSDEGSTSRSWTVTARQAGTATITLTGSPACRSETPSCADPEESWTASFTVQ